MNHPQHRISRVMLERYVHYTASSPRRYIDFLLWLSLTLWMYLFLWLCPLSWAYLHQ